MKVIGITGTCGAGKGTIVEYLIEKKEFVHYSAREFIVKEIKKRGMDVNRDSMRIVANDLREKNGPAFIIEELYKKAIKSRKNCIIESVRCPGEIDSLETKLDFELWAVNADSMIRYDRAFLRGGSTDNVDYETFLEQEKSEMNNTDPFKQNLFLCMKRAKYVFNNDSDVNSLYKQVDEVLEE